MPEPTPATLYLIDGTSQLYRAYFALPGLTNSEGLPTHAVFGFTNMLRKLIHEERPASIGVAFDLPGKSFRAEVYAEYKANRPPTPEDLVVQMPYAKRVCRALGVSVLEREGYEADDLIASLAVQARRHGTQVVIVASDKDLLQLVGDGVTVLNPAKNLRLDTAEVEEQFGVPPEHVRDVLGLMGDSVDNIPGVPGVGEKTALSCIRTYGEIEAVLRRAERFVAGFDARDALLAAIDELTGADEVDQATLRQFEEARRTLRDRLEGWIGHEADAEFESRLVELGEALESPGIAELREAEGQPGKRTTRGLARMKRTLKSLERKSSRRVWYAIHEHAEQARLSRELATLDESLDVDATPQALELRPADRSAAHELFSMLGFTALVREFEAEGDDGSMATAAAEVETRTIDAASGLAEAVAACRESGECGVFPVVEGDHPMYARLVGLGLAPTTSRAWYLALARETLDAPAIPDTAELAELLDDGEVRKVVWDLKQADHALRRAGMPARGYALDAMVAAFLLNAGRAEVRLPSIAREHLGVGLIAGQDLFGRGAKRIGAERIELPRLSGYAGERAAALVGLGQRLPERLAEAGLAELYSEIDGPLLPLLSRMEARGIAVDLDLLADMSGEMETALQHTRSEIHRLAGEEFNVDSPKQLREVLFDKLGLAPRRKTAKSGVASTDAQTLEPLAQDHAIARRLLEYRELAKLKGTYVDALPRLVHPETGRVHTVYHPTGAATGRLSSSDPNLQNIPARSEAGKKIRRAFVAGPGQRFLASDYSQIELRVLAHLTDDEDLVGAFRAGEDIHRHTAARVFGVAADLVTDAMRTRAKAVNFGILYGMSETRLAREQGMKRKEARAFIESYFERFSSVRAYIEETREAALRDAAVRTMFGRVRYFPVLRQRANRAVREQALRAAVNTTLQGAAADLMKIAMLRVDSGLRQRGLDAQVLLQVHDELLLEVPEEQLDATCEAVRGAMEGAAEMSVPLVVDQKTGANWFEVT